MFSTYIQPAVPNISNVLMPVASQTIIVKDGGGYVYWPQYNLNTIGNVQTGRGYKIKMVSTQNLTITGTQVIPENYPLVVDIGWSIIGYLRIFPTNIDSAFSGIINNLIMVKDDLGNIYWPLQGINQIEIINPGKGYDIKILNADTINYAANIFVCGTDAVTDFDGNSYNTVQIGDQCWMKENLATTHYADGTALVDGASAYNISQNYTKYWFVYNNNLSNKATYGLLYTWTAVMNGTASSNANPSGVQGVCPTGWHVPGDVELKQLEIFLGMSQSQADASGWRGTTEGGKFKETGTAHWTSPNTGADNSSGYTALPGGNRDYNGPFGNLGYSGYLWSTTESDANSAWGRVLGYNSTQVFRSGQYYGGYAKTNGFSVRCVRDY